MDYISLLTNSYDSLTDPNSQTFGHQTDNRVYYCMEKRKKKKKKEKKKKLTKLD